MNDYGRRSWRLSLGSLTCVCVDKQTVERSSWEDGDHLCSELFAGPIVDEGMVFPSQEHRCVTTEATQMLSSPVARDAVQASVGYGLVLPAHQKGDPFSPVLVPVSSVFSSSNGGSTCSPTFDAPLAQTYEVEAISVQQGGSEPKEEISFLIESRQTPSCIDASSDRQGAVDLGWTTCWGFLHLSPTVAIKLRGHVRRISGMVGCSVFSSFAQAQSRAPSRPGANSKGEAPEHASPQNSSLEAAVPQSQPIVSTGDENELDATACTPTRDLNVFGTESTLIDSLGRDISVIGGDDGKEFSLTNSYASDDAKMASLLDGALESTGSAAAFGLRGLGFTCQKGLKSDDAPNQDSWCAVRTDTHSVFGVFDGHGKHGHHVSHFTKDILPRLLINDERFGGEAMPQMLKDGFASMQELIHAAHEAGRFNAQWSGTTATICILDRLKNKATVAHVANSACVLGSQRAFEKGAEALMLTCGAHRPNQAQERARIEKQGGRVVFDGYANYRVTGFEGSSLPGLNISRCLGNLGGHRHCGLNCEPEVLEYDLCSEAKMILLCSDGVWEFVTPADAVEIIARYPPSEAAAAADELAKVARNRWLEEERGSRIDDITIVLACLDRGEAQDARKTVRFREDQCRHQVVAMGGG